MKTVKLVFAQITTESHHTITLFSLTSPNKQMFLLRTKGDFYAVIYMLFTMETTACFEVSLCEKT